MNGRDRDSRTARERVPGLAAGGRGSCRERGLHVKSHSLFAIQAAVSMGLALCRTSGEEASEWLGINAHGLKDHFTK